MTGEKGFKILPEGWRFWKLFHRCLAGAKSGSTLAMLNPSTPKLMYGVTLSDYQIEFSSNFYGTVIR